jgi:hypothetical protein
MMAAGDNRTYSFCLEASDTVLILLRTVVSGVHKRRGYNVGLRRDKRDTIYSVSKFAYEYVVHVVSDVD